MRETAIARPVPCFDAGADLPTDPGADHPWYLDLRPDPSGTGRSEDAHATLMALDAIGAVAIAVHADIVPSLAELVAGRSYIGWTICVPGAVDRATIEAIAATAGAGYLATVVPGHPLPATADVVGGQ